MRSHRWEGDAPLSKRFLCGLSCVTVKVSSKIILLEVAEESSMVILNLRFRTQYDLSCFLSIHSIHHVSKNMCMQRRSTTLGIPLVQWAA